MRRNSAAFTLIELLVVVTIIGILVSLIFTIAPSLIKKGNLVKSLNNMRQVANGLMMYAGDNDGRLPVRSLGSVDKWPKIVDEYLRDPKIFAAPDDQKNYLKAGIDPTSNATNNTSYIMNGGLDPGTDEETASKKPLVLSAIAEPSQTILLGCLFGDDNFFLDVANGDHELINPKQFGSSNCYVFMDSSARSIEAEEYQKENSKNGAEAYLWLINKDAR